MRLNRAVAAGLLLPAMAIGVAACGSDNSGSADTSTGSAPAGGKLTIYSSLPMQGAGRAQSLDLVNGMKLALKEAGGKAGTFTVKYVPQGRLDRPSRQVDA